MNKKQRIRTFMYFVKGVLSEYNPEESKHGYEEATELLNIIINEIKEIEALKE